MRMAAHEVSAHGPAEQKHDEFFGIVRNLPPDTIRRIQDRLVTAEERARSDKVRLACAVWEEYLALTRGAYLDADRQLQHSV